MEVVKEVVHDLEEKESSRAVQAPERSSSVELLVEAEEKEKEKPLFSASFGHKKPLKLKSEGKASALGVSKSKKQDTLENTWKMIEDGRSTPLTRHLIKKSETWNSHQVRPPTPTQNKMKRSDTSSESKTSKKKKKKKKKQSGNDHIEMNKNGNQKLRKEPSLSQEELNRRVEAFINKFNEDMRLQRQETWNQYLEMIKHGGYREFVLM